MINFTEDGDAVVWFNVINSGQEPQRKYLSFRLDDFLALVKVCKTAEELRAMMFNSDARLPDRNVKFFRAAA